MPPESDTMAVEIRGKKAPKNISPPRLDRAARELNLLNISSKGLHNVATVGQFLTEIGLIRYGNGRLLGSAQAMQEGMLYCLELARNAELDHEVRQKYLDLGIRFRNALDENVALQMDVNKVQAKETNGAVSGAKSFLPGAQIQPIQINLSGGATATITEKKADNERDSCKT